MVYPGKFFIRTKGHLKRFPSMYANSQSDHSWPSRNRHLTKNGEFLANLQIKSRKVFISCLSSYGQVKICEHVTITKCSHLE